MIKLNSENLLHENEKKFSHYIVDKVGKLVPEFSDKANELGIVKEREKFIILTAMITLGKTAEISRKKQFGK